MEAELLDWELVHGSDTEPTDSIALEMESVVIPSPHFSPDNQSLESVFDHFEIGLSDENHADIDAVADDESHIEDATECLSETEHLQVADAGESIDDRSNSCIDSGGKQLVSIDSGFFYGEEEIGSAVEESGGDAVAVRCGDESKSRDTVWWKMPFVLVKYCAFRIGPVWSVSMAAAFMGFLLLGRRLYNTKKKPQRIHLKVAIDYKKVSQVMSQAARLNEAFTEVRRVPVIRPALPAPGALPVLSLR